MDWRTFGGGDASVASTWFGLRHARLEIVVLQPTVVSRFGCFVFESWVLRFRDLGASCFGLCYRVLRYGNYLNNKAALRRMDTLIRPIDPPAKHDGLLCRFWFLVFVFFNVYN